MNPVETDVVSAVGQLRKLVCGLGLGLLVLSLALNGFVLKQNRNLGAVITTRRAQVKQLQVAQTQWLPVLNELVQYSQGKPQLQAVLQKCGITFTPAPPAKK